MEITKQEGHSRAAKGGQFGANGEWYSGGKFIATTDHPKGCKPARKGCARRVQVGPAEFTEGREGALPLWQTLSGLVELRELWEAHGCRFRDVSRWGAFGLLFGLCPARVAQNYDGERVGVSVVENGRFSTSWIFVPTIHPPPPPTPLAIPPPSNCKRIVK